MPRYDAVLNKYVYGDDPDSDTIHAVDGPIGHSGNVHALTKPSAGTFPLTPPTAGEEGAILTVRSRTPFAHVVTIAEGIAGKGAGFTTLTFNAVGDTIQLQADNLHWTLVGAPAGVVIS